MAMATDMTKQIQKTVEIKTFANLLIPKKWHEIRTGNKTKIYDGYGHRHTKQIQKTVEIQTFTNLLAPKKWQEIRTRKTKDLWWLWPPTHKANPEDRRNPNIYKPIDT